ncbi:MAG: helix-turn-helix transcriptional regulator [Gammaproteobacteria bacterium]|nr:helix-turn-helix transcriptional regulator [Gammaproteobacteria bacterium]
MSKRSYKQNCALARANDVIGERWTLLLVRDLLISPRRFNQLHASQKGMGTNLLASRLKDLEMANVVERRAGEGGARLYALTERGRALEPAVLALIRWGLTHGPENRPGDHHHDDWDLLALKSMFQPDRAKGLKVCVQFEAPELEGWARIEDEEMCIGIGEAGHADVVINATITDLFVDADNRLDLLTNGEPSLLQRFMHAFTLQHRSGHLLVW